MFSRVTKAFQENHMKIKLNYIFRVKIRHLLLHKPRIRRVLKVLGLRKVTLLRLLTCEGLWNAAERSASLNTSEPTAESIPATDVFPHLFNRFLKAYRKRLGAKLLFSRLWEDHDLIVSSWTSIFF